MSQQTTACQQRWRFNALSTNTPPPPLGLELIFVSSLFPLFTHAAGLLSYNHCSMPTRLFNQYPSSPVHRLQLHPPGGRFVFLVNRHQTHPSAKLTFRNLQRQQWHSPSCGAMASMSHFTVPAVDQCIRQLPMIGIRHTVCTTMTTMTVDYTTVGVL